MSFTAAGSGSHQRVRVAIIGAGTAGLAAAKVVAKKTDDFVLIDPGPLGTTCARTGCMPSKAFIEVANDLHHARERQKSGLITGVPITAATAQVFEYVRAQRDRFVAGAVKTTMSFGERFIQARASFVSPRQLRVGDRLIEAERIIIATGSSPILPEDWRALGSNVLTSEEVFELDRAPETLAVIGTGPVGLELAMAFARFGTRVVCFSRDNKLAGLTDPVVLKEASAVFGANIQFVVGEKATLALATAGEVSALTVKCGTRSYTVEKVLVAIGRKPNLSALDLEAAGLKLNAEGLLDFDKESGRTDVESISLAGDVTADRPILHEAAHAGKIAARVALGLEMKSERLVPIGICFTDPQVAFAGSRFADLDATKVVIGEASFGNQGRSVLMNGNAGVVRVYADRGSHGILGCEMICPAAEHLAHLMSLAIGQELTVEQMLRMPIYHPTVEEGLATALKNAVKALSASPDEKR